jgi:hypothetical protein
MTYRRQIIADKQRFPAGLLADKINHDWRNPETYDRANGSVVDS